MKFFFLLLVTFGISRAFGTPANETQEANDYFEAADYPHAKMLYEGLLDEKINYWEKDIIEYNIATVYLAQEKWEEALVRFEKLAGKKITLPLLEQKVKFNLALSRLQIVKEQLKSFKTQTNVSYDDYNQAYTSANAALSDMDRAYTAWCALESAEGATNCPESIALQNMRLEMKNLLNELFQNFSSYRLKHLSIPDGTSSLLLAENTWSNQLGIFQDHKLTENLQKKYLEDFKIQAESWEPVWDQLDQVFMSSSKIPHQDAEKKLFKNAYESFVNSLSLATKGNFTESIEQLNMSQKLLNELLHQYISSSPLKDILQQILTTYELALIKAPLNEDYLMQILQMLIATEEAIKDYGHSLSTEYEKAQKYLKLSIDALKNFQSIKARFFGEIGRFYIKKMANQMDSTPKVMATAVLKNAIANQELILLLNQLKKELPKEDDHVAESANLLTALQKETLQTAGRFPDAVLSQQKEAFNSNTPGKTRCQCHPWDEVIPLFSQGYTNANLAHQQQLSENLNLAAIQHNQQLAVDAWKEALAKMRDFKASQQQQKQSETASQSTQQLAQEKEQSMEKEQNAKFNEILRLVQDMENDDRSQPQQVKTSGSKKEEKPW